MLGIHMLKGQLHILLRIIVIDVITEIMHGKKIIQIYLAVSLLVFFEVLKERREFTQLVQGNGVYTDTKQHDVYKHSFHSSKNKVIRAF